MTKFIKILFVLLIFSLISCSSVAHLQSNHAMSNQAVFARDGEVKFLMPSGYIKPVDQQLDKFDFWLISNNLNSSISLNRINIDHKTVRSIYKHRLATLLKFSKTLRRAQYGKSYQKVGQDEFFIINGISCASAKLIVKDKCLQRIIVFEYKNRYYELTACNSDLKIENQKLDFLFNAQNSMLASIE